MVLAGNRWQTQMGDRRMYLMWIWRRDLQPRAVTAEKMGTAKHLPGVTLELLGDGASQVVLVVKNPPVNAGEVRDVSSTPGLGRSPGGGHGNPLQYSCLENPMDRGARRATDTTGGRVLLAPISSLFFAHLSRTLHYIYHGMLDLE